MKVLEKAPPTRQRGGPAERQRAAPSPPAATRTASRSLRGVTRRASTPIATAALCVCALVAGCGGGTHKSADEQVRDAFARYTKAFVNGNAKGACALLTPGARQRAVRQSADFGLKSCEAVLMRGHDALSPPQRDQVRRATIGAVTVKGDAATIRIKTRLAGQQTVTRLRRVDGDWRIDA